jgi:L-seryl-tRNA(Ser) seleniumtransferase
LSSDPVSRLPAVDRVLRHADALPLIERHGRLPATEAIRAALADLRAAKAVADEAGVAALAGRRLAAEMAPSQRRVFNLTGTVLHTNLGRAVLARRRTSNTWSRRARAASATTTCAAGCAS